MDTTEQRGVQVVSFSLTAIEHPTNPAFDDGAAASSRQFVLVHEKEERGWWLPGGGVDAGQTLAEAAVREAAEEAGCDVSLTGVLRIEIGYGQRMGRMRILWHAQPIDAALPLKSVPDKESRGAAWATLPHTVKVQQRKVPGVEHCWLRGAEPLQYFRYLCRPDRPRAAPIAPVDLIVSERLDGGAAPEWTGPGDPPRALYETTMEVELVGLARGEGAATPSVLYTDSKGRLPSAHVAPGQGLQRTAEQLARSHGLASLLGLARFLHIIDVARGTARIVVTYAAAGPRGASGATWQPDSAFVPAQRPLLQRIMGGQVYPLCLLTEEEGSDPQLPDTCASQVDAIRAFFS